MKTSYTLEDTNLIGNLIGVNWVKHEHEQFRAGIMIELELNNSAPGAAVSNVELILAGKIVRDNLNAAPDYYSKFSGTGINREVQSNPERIRYAVDATADSIVDPPFTETYGSYYKEHREENRRDNNKLKISDTAQ